MQLIRSVIYVYHLLFSFWACKVWYPQVAQLYTTNISENKIPNLCKSLWYPTCSGLGPVVALPIFHFFWFTFTLQPPYPKWSSIIMAPYLFTSFRFLLRSHPSEMPPCQTSTLILLIAFQSLSLLYFPLCTYSANILYIW